MCVRARACVCSYEEVEVWWCWQKRWRVAGQQDEYLRHQHCRLHRHPCRLLWRSCVVCILDDNYDDDDDDIGEGREGSVGGGGEGGGPLGGEDLTASGTTRWWWWWWNREH